MSKPITVPFLLLDIHGGFGEGDGSIEVDESGLSIRFETRDNAFGVLKSGVKETRIPLDDITSAEAKTGSFGRWVAGSLIVTTSNPVISNTVPSSRRGRIELYIQRADWEAAKEAALLLKRRLVEKDVEDFKKELDARDEDAPGLPGDAT